MIRQSKSITKPVKNRKMAMVIFYPGCSSNFRTCSVVEHDHRYQACKAAALSFSVFVPLANGIQRVNGPLPTLVQAKASELSFKEQGLKPCLLVSWFSNARITVRGGKYEEGACDFAYGNKSRLLGLLLLLMIIYIHSSPPSSI